MKVCHLTSAHPQEDVRIFQKECVSLARNGFCVYQVSCGTSYEKSGVHLIGIGTAPKKRIKRMILTAFKTYYFARKCDANLYHLHDPELLPYALNLKRKGAIVVFDSHEDIPGQIMDKEWIPKPLRILISKAYFLLETYVIKRIDAVVAATAHIEEKFVDRANRTITINNYPKLDDIIFHDIPFEEKDPIICYAGGISDNRGNSIMKDAMNNVNGNLIIAGDHIIQGYDNVQYVGRLSREEINDLYKKSVLGLCILKPIENYYYSQPIKMYEYMAAGIPFVCSNFPSWVKLVQDSECGICVDPENIDEISGAISYLLNNRTIAEEMGKKGYKYVTRNCSWESEEYKLIKLYRSF